MNDPDKITLYSDPIEADSYYSEITKKEELSWHQDETFEKLAALVDEFLQQYPDSSPISDKDKQDLIQVLKNKHEHWKTEKDVKEELQQLGYQLSKNPAETVRYQLTPGLQRLLEHTIVHKHRGDSTFRLWKLEPEKKPESSADEKEPPPSPKR